MFHKVVTPFSLVEIWTFEDTPFIPSPVTKGPTTLQCSQSFVAPVYHQIQIRHTFNMSLCQKKKKKAEKDHLYFEFYVAANCLGTSVSRFFQFEKKKLNQPVTHPVSLQLKLYCLKREDTAETNSWGYLGAVSRGASFQDRSRQLWPQEQTKGQRRLGFVFWGFSLHRPLW